MQSVLYDKSFEFAVLVVDTAKKLMNRRLYVLSNQILRSGTAIGANLAEAQYAQSKPDFVSKASIALKEASETKYWLKLFEATGDIGLDEAEMLIDKVDELIRMLTSSIKTAKINMDKLKNIQ